MESNHCAKFCRLLAKPLTQPALLVKNNSTKDISKCLHISEKTVRNHISNVIQKLDCKNRSCALVELIKLGEISI